MCVYTISNPIVKRPKRCDRNPKQKVHLINSSTESTGDLRRRHQQGIPAAPTAAVAQTSTAFLNFSRVPLRPSSGPAVKAKLTVGSPSDQYEQEADRVAEQVIRMLAPDQAVGRVRSHPTYNSA